MGHCVEHFVCFSFWKEQLFTSYCTLRDVTKIPSPLADHYSPDVSVCLLLSLSLSPIACLSTPLYVPVCLCSSSVCLSVSICYPGSLSLPLFLSPCLSFSISIHVTLSLSLIPSFYPCICSVSCMSFLSISVPVLISVMFVNSRRIPEGDEKLSDTFITICPRTLSNSK